MKLFEKSVNTQLSVKCLKNKDGYLYTKCSMTYRIMAKHLHFGMNFMKETVNNEYVLEKKGLVINSRESRQFISYEKLKEAVEKWPMLEYKGRIIIVIDYKIIDIYYLKLLGGADFIVNLAKKLQIDYINKEVLLYKNRYGIALASKKDKEEYKRRRIFINENTRK